MLINQQFINAFTGHINAANSGRLDRAARLTPKSSFWQKESSMRPILVELNQRLNQNVTWANHKHVFQPLFVNMKPEKQRKYSAAIKFLQKSLMGQASHMFAALRANQANGQPLSTKLSKSQQRYTIPIVEGDAGPGLCLHMALLWLKEQMSFHVRSNFPRLEGKNVVASKNAWKLTTAAMANRAHSNETVAAAARLGLTAESQHWAYGFQTIHNKFQQAQEVRPLLISFYDSHHVVALIRERSGSFQFYDSNAGSYRIQPHLLQTFLVTYNDTCLPLKWPTYAEPANKKFSGIYTVVKA